MNKVLVLLCITFFIFANTKYTSKIKIKGIPQDLLVHENNIIVANDEGELQKYNYKTKLKTKIISLDKIKDFTGEDIYPSVYSIDYLDGTYLIVSDSGNNGFSNMWTYKNNVLKQIISFLDKKVIIKAKFINKNEVLLGFLGNEVALFDIKTKKNVYLKKLRNSRLSDFAIDIDKQKAIFSSESGIFDIIDIKNGEILKTPKPIHVDNVFKVSYKNGIISGAGQDRRASIYNYKKDYAYYIKAPFLVYNTDLSPSGNLVAFTMSENNDISIFNTNTKQKVKTLRGLHRIIKILFKDEKTIIAISSNSNILIWELK